MCARRPRTALGRMPVGLGFVVAALAAAVPATAAEAGDAARGQVVYERCEACHSPDLDRIGPHDRGIVGRVAGSVKGFDYSPALRKAGFVWTEALLDRWLTDPQKLVPGNKMGFRLGDPAMRADVIAYLKTLN